MYILTNILHYYVGLIRGDTEFIPHNVYGSALSNIIKTMCKSRNSKIYGENFDCIDFGNLILNNIYFSDNGQSPSSFRKCRFTEWNVHGGLRGRLYHVEFSDDCKYLITISNDGKAIVWDIESRMMKKVFPVCEPFKLFSQEEEIGDLSKSMIFFETHSNKGNFSANDPPKSSDIDVIKHNMLAEFFSSEYKKQKVFSDDVISNIISKFQNVNKKEFEHQYSYNNEDTIFPIEIFSSGKLAFKFAVTFPPKEEMLFSDARIKSVLISNNGTYCVLNYMGYKYLFETSSGRIIRKCHDDIIVSGDEMYYTVYSARYFQVYTTVDNSMILDIGRNVQKISNVDIDIKNGQALSMSVGSNDWRKQPLFIWDLSRMSIIGKTVFNTVEMIDYNIKNNPQFQTDELDSWEKFTLSSLMMSKITLSARPNIVFDISKNEDYDYFFWEIHYSVDESFCLVFEYNQFENLFQYQDKNEKIDVSAFRGRVICAVLAQNDETLYLFTTYNKIYCWNTKQRIFINSVDIEIPCEVFVTSAQFSVDASFLFVGTDSGEILLIDTDNGKIIERFYHIDSLHMENCDMEQIVTDSLTKKILYQNGAFLSI